MILTIDFNFTRADICDPQSKDDCELLDIKLDGETVPLRVKNDLALNHHLLTALYRIHQIISK